MNIPGWSFSAVIYVSDYKLVNYRWKNDIVLASYSDTPRVNEAPQGVGHSFYSYVTLKIEINRRDKP